MKLLIKKKIYFVQPFYRLSANTLTKHVHEAVLLMIYKAALFTSQAVWYLTQDEATVTDAIHAIYNFSQVSNKNFIDLIGSWHFPLASILWWVFDFCAVNQRLSYLHVGEPKVKNLLFNLFCSYQKSECPGIHTLQVQTVTHWLHLCWPV